MDQVIQPITVFDSRRFAPGDVIDAWLSMISPTFRIGLDADERRPFEARFQVIHLQEAMLTGASISAQRFERGPQQVRQDGVDQCGLFAQVTGSRVVRVNGGEVELRPGDIQFVDMAQEEDSLATSGNTAALYLPRDVIASEFPGFWRLHGTVARNPVTQVFSRTLVDLLQGTGWPVDAVPYLNRSITSLAMSCILSVEPGNDALPSGRDESLRHRIEAFIEERLADTSLDTETIREEFDLSRSTLYRLFRHHGGVHTFVRDRRLRAARRLLQARDPRSLALLAQSVGFVSQAHFSREFRRAYGVSPSRFGEETVLARPHPTGVESLVSMFRLTGS